MCGNRASVAAPFQWCVRGFSVTRCLSLSTNLCLCSSVARLAVPSLISGCLLRLSWRICIYICSCANFSTLPGWLLSGILYRLQTSLSPPSLEWNNENEMKCAAAR
ncbi:hypothetical protein M404DRAFT_843537 [Pisolithus tinctorius Marx 270]|uniref:Uncharacterized protein n=1 Tax=Pisolithus tinctorius Marx 270 TaxID=870435 RepID=A0A0C3PS09_PISTI|nr:hypothetical protein M404DRAFT_843537 [Pisolithus tinctorius Marx 270]